MNKNSGKDYESIQGKIKSKAEIEDSVILEKETLQGKGEEKTKLDELIRWEAEKNDLLKLIDNVGNDEVFTPVETCQRMLDELFPEDHEVWSNPDLKWLNPCDKNGVFFREIALRLDKGLTKIIPDEYARKKHIMTKMLFSIGLTKFTSLMVRRTLYYCIKANKRKISEDEGCAIANGARFNNEFGNVVTPYKEHYFGKESKSKNCHFCGTNKNSKYVNSMTEEKYAYDFIHLNSDEYENYFKTNFGVMKFDVIIGNPPYQLSNGSGSDGNGAKAIFQDFVLKAIDLEPKYLAMIIPAKWMISAENIFLNLRDKLKKNKGIKEINIFFDSKDCFPKREIKGGICYFIWQNNYQGKTLINTKFSKKGKSTEIDSSKRNLFVSVLNNTEQIIFRKRIWQDIYTKIDSISASEMKNTHTHRERERERAI
ncbi:Eco57I restriction-modification methylase domain-containing protein [Mycoplasmoides pneumoniae]|uniref:Eco57I restriction-modification methylase domain-containing protein n=1 Tax=Mycoplasmoides pneumoniae TaxID=2104 RepID=UPI0006BA2ABB|nr:class I SAM-dependent methyltransferase [Mycoplasmoides pneumoniae]